MAAAWPRRARPGAEQHQRAQGSNGVYPCSHRLFLSESRKVHRGYALGMGKLASYRTANVTFTTAVMSFSSEVTSLIP